METAGAKGLRQERTEVGGACWGLGSAVSGVSAVGRRVSWPVSSPGCRARQQCLLTAPGGRGACEGRPGRA